MYRTNYSLEHESTCTTLSMFHAFSRAEAHLFTVRLNAMINSYYINVHHGIGLSLPETSVIVIPGHL